MKLKLDDAGHAVLQDGKPVYIHDDGKEVAFDAAGTVATIGRLNGEAKSHRERAEAAEKIAKAYEGIDADAARKALKSQENWDEKQRTAAGERDRAIADAVKAIESKYEPVVKKAAELESALSNEMIGGSFARSEFIKKKMAENYLPDVVKAVFGSNFKIEDGKVVAYDGTGNKVLSRTNFGNPAGFEEALEILVESHPAKDHFLRGTGASGSGAGPSNGGSAGKKEWTREQFEAASQTARMEFSKAGGKVI